MNQLQTLLTAILLMAAALLISFMGQRTDGSIDIELSDFFAGILLGGGVTLLIKTILDWRKQKQP